MNIDVRKKKRYVTNPAYDDELGDEGFFFSLRFRRKIAKANKSRPCDSLRIISNISKLSLR